MAEKKILPKDLSGAAGAGLGRRRPLAAREAVAALTGLTLVSRARGLGMAEAFRETTLAEHPVVAAAREALA